MACTTVPIAAKRATFPLPTVANEPKRIRLQIDADSRLAAAAGGAARYFADAAGLEGGAVTHLQIAIVAACEEAFGHLTGGHHLDVTLTRLVDRIEVSLSLEGETAPAVGLDSLAGLAIGAGRASGQGAGKGAVLEGVDRVQYETRGGVAITLLTKYITQATHIS
jgi:hypothetical protein